MQWLKRHRNVQRCFLILLICGLSLAVNTVTVKATGNREIVKSQAVCRVGDIFEISMGWYLSGVNLDWSSSDDTIAEIVDASSENFTVKAKKLGTAVITGTNSKDKKIKVQYKIDVMDGVYSANGNLVLDKNGNLTVVDFAKIEDSYRGKIKKAKVIVTEMCTPEPSVFENCSKLTQVELEVVASKEKRFHDMSYMFSGCSSLKKVDFSTLDTSRVTDMSHMFENCKSLKSVDLSSFNTSKVRDMSYMFSGCKSLKNLDLSMLDTSNVRTMQLIFKDCTSLKKLNMSGLDLSKVTKVAGYHENGGGYDQEMIFYNCDSLEDIDMSNVDLSNVKYLTRMFAHCPNIRTINLQNLYIPKVTSMMFMCGANKGNWGINYATKLRTVAMRGVYAPKLKNMFAAFADCSGLKNVYLDGMNAPGIEVFSSAFARCTSLEKVDLSSLGFNKCDMEQAFGGCSKLRTVNLNTIHKSSVRSMAGMFLDCPNLKNIYMNTLDVSRVTNMGNLFGFCRSLQVVDLSGWTPKKLTNMHAMFYGCSNLRTVNLENFETDKVSDMQLMFLGCSKLEALNIANFTLSQKLAGEVQGNYIVGVGDFFNGCVSLKYVKTPKDVQVKVALPHEMQASGGGKYSTLPSGGSKVLSVGGFQPTVIKVAKVSMNKSSTTMRVKEKIKLSANVSPMVANSKFTWKSSNKKIATVDAKGNVIAKKAGNVTITATSKENRKMKTTCKIKIYAKIKSVKLTGTKKVLKVGETLNLKTTMNPITAEKKFWYRSSDTTVAQVGASGKVVAKMPGTTTITVISMENKKIKASYKITVKGKDTTTKEKKKDGIVTTREVPMQKSDIAESPVTAEVPKTSGIME